MGKFLLMIAFDLNVSVSRPTCQWRLRRHLFGVLDHICLGRHRTFIFRFCFMAGDKFIKSIPLSLLQFILLCPLHSNLLPAVASSFSWSCFQVALAPSFLSGVQIPYSCIYILFCSMTILMFKMLRQMGKTLPADKS